MQEISLNILDIVQNSISAGSTLVGITVDEQPRQKLLGVTVTDNGCGMTPEQVRAVTDPFYTTRKTRKVGLGVPLLKMSAEMAGGRFEIDSRKGEGTRVFASFRLDNIDMMPLGDINATVILLVTCNPGIDFCYKRVVGERSFTLDTREVKNILAGVPVNAPEVTTFLSDFLRENENELKNGGTAAEKAGPSAEAGEA